MARSNRSFLLSSTFVLFTSFGCASLLGVEEPLEDGSGGAAGEGPGGSRGDGGTQVSGGTPGAGGTAHEEPTGGTSNGGSPMEGTGGSSSTGSQANGGSSGGRPAESDGGSAGAGSDGGSGGAAPSTVTGRIVDLFDRGLPNVAIRLAEGDAVLTDDQGRFTVENAPENYDAEFLVTARGGYYQRVYRFIGLTRRDPTLRIDDDVGDQEARIDVSVSDLPTNDEGDLSVSVRSPIDFYFAGDEEGSQGTVAIDYDGEDPFPSTLRALFWNDSGIASEFYGLASKSFALNDSEITDVVLDSWEPLSSTGQLSGFIQAPGTNPSVEVTAFLNFPDGASLPLQTVPWNSSTESFAMTVPEVPSGATFSVLACVWDTGFTCAHKDGFPLGASADNIELTLPSRVELIEPAHERNDVTDETTFRWRPAGDGPCAMLQLNNSGWARGMRIITCESEVTMGAGVVAGLLAPGENIYWNVHTYGPAQNVDDMAGPDGFIDPYYQGRHAGIYPRGKNRPLSGQLTRSENRTFSFSE